LGNCGSLWPSGQCRVNPLRRIEGGGPVTRRPDADAAGLVRRANGEPQQLWACALGTGRGGSDVVCRLARHYRSCSDSLTVDSRSSALSWASN